jgi:hypothetical protein
VTDPAVLEALVGGRSGATSLPPDRNVAPYRLCPSPMGKTQKAVETCAFTPGLDGAAGGA